MSSCKAVTGVYLVCHLRPPPLSFFTAHFACSLVTVKLVSLF